MLIIDQKNVLYIFRNFNSLDIDFLFRLWLSILCDIDLVIFFPFQTNLERAKDTVINMGAVLFSGIHVTNFLGVIVLAFAK